MIEFPNVDYVFTDHKGTVNNEVEMEDLTTGITVEVDWGFNIKDCSNEDMVADVLTETFDHLCNIVTRKLSVQWRNTGNIICHNDWRTL